MSGLPARLLAIGFGLALIAAAAPADAKKAAHHHHKKAAVHHRLKSGSTCRGANLFPCGPVYFDDHYIGDDPDPFIRLQLLRGYGHAASLY